MNAPVPDKPRQLTKEDRRIIFSKLNEVYVDERTGYSASWTDGSVATNLGVPTEWVKQIRDENFGPLAINPEVLALINECRQIREEVRRICGSQPRHGRDRQGRAAGSGRGWGYPASGI